MMAHAKLAGQSSWSAPLAMKFQHPSSTAKSEEDGRRNRRQQDARTSQPTLFCSGSFCSLDACGSRSGLSRRTRSRRLPSLQAAASGVSRQTSTKCQACSRHHRATSAEQCQTRAMSRSHRAAPCTRKPFGSPMTPRKPPVTSSSGSPGAMSIRWPRTHSSVTRVRSTARRSSSSMISRNSSQKPRKLLLWSASDRGRLRQRLLPRARFIRLRAAIGLPCPEMPPCPHIGRNSGGTFLLLQLFTLDWLPP